MARQGPREVNPRPVVEPGARRIFQNIADDARELAFVSNQVVVKAVS